MKKFKVGVFMGGGSVEREVSLNSGRTVCDNFGDEFCEVIPIFQSPKDGFLYLLPLQFLHRGKISDFVDRLENCAQRVLWQELPSMIDFAYIAMHGRGGEDGCLQGCFEILKIPYLGSSVIGSAFGMDKWRQKVILNGKGVGVPKSFLLPYKKRFDKNFIAKNVCDNDMSFPLVVKPNHEGSSLGVFIVKDVDDTISKVNIAATVSENILQDVCIEEFVVGKEFSCILVEKDKGKWEALNVTEIVVEGNSKIFDYQQKYMPGRGCKFTPARFDVYEKENVVQTCCTVCSELKFKTCARIDGILTERNKVVIIDPNTLSGMAPSSLLFDQVATQNMNHSDWFHLLLKLSNVEVFMKDLNDKASNKKKIGVLLGGDSDEREVSLDSGRNVCYKISGTKYDVTPIFVREDMRLFAIPQKLLVKNRTKEIEENLHQCRQISWDHLRQDFDFIFIALHGGSGENGCVQGFLETLQIPYNGSGVFASAICNNKNETAKFLQARGFDVSKRVFLGDYEEDIESVKKLCGETVKFPCVVKPNKSGCSNGVSKVFSLQDMEDSIDNLFRNGYSEILVEELIYGVELTVGVMGNDSEGVIVFPPSQTIASNGILSIEEKFLPGAGENVTPASLDECSVSLVQDIVKRAFLDLECKGYARFDGFFDDNLGKFVILEVNTLPALTPATCFFHQAAELKMTPRDVLEKIISLGFCLRSHIDANV